MKTLFIASEFEADFFTDGLSQVSEHIYEGDYRVVITGIGLVNTTITCTDFFTNHQPTQDDEYINAGIAGSVKNSLKIGQIIEPKCFKIYTPIEIPESSTIIFNTAYPTIDRGDLLLASAMAPVWGKEHIHNLKNMEAVAVDMEGYSFARVCAKHNLPFRVIKVISDHLIKRDHNKFIENSKSGLQKLRDSII